MNKFCFALEREQINPHIKPSNKNGNNGGTCQSTRIPTRWKAVKFIDNATIDQAISQFSCYSEKGFRLINWDTNEIIFDNGSIY